MTRLLKLCWSGVTSSVVLSALSQGAVVLVGLAVACLAILVWILSNDRVVQRFNTLARGVPLPPRTAGRSKAAKAELAEASAAEELASWGFAVPVETAPDPPTMEEEIDKFIESLVYAGNLKLARRVELVKRRLAEQDETVEGLRRRYAGKPSPPAQQ